MAKNNMTAVEWFYQQTVIEGKTNYWELLEQAKQMEKDQICDALDFGKVCLLQSNYKKAEQYYNETFGK